MNRSDTSLPISVVALTAAIIAACVDAPEAAPDVARSAKEVSQPHTESSTRSTGLALWRKPSPPLNESGVFKVTCPRSCEETAAIAAKWSPDTLPRYTDERGVIQVLEYSQFKADGSVGDGSDDSLAIQAALHAAAGAPVFFGAAQYAVCCPITVPGDKPVTLSGPEAAFAYNNGLVEVPKDSKKWKAVVLPATLWASYSFPPNRAMLDLREHTNVSIRFLGFTLPAGLALDTPGSSYAVELGTRTGGQMYPDHHIEGCSIFGGAAGIRARNAGIMRIRNNNLSNQTLASLWLQQYCGDSELEGNYINSNNRGQTSGGVLEGTGIFLGQGCGNTSIRGGKIEHTSYGISMYMTGGINISGINFDYNTYGHIHVQDAGDDPTTPVGSINITGNRFLGGGFAGSHSHIFFEAYVPAANKNHRMYANVTGNSFRRGGAWAYDHNHESDSDAGPSYAVVRVDSGGPASVRINMAGNDMIAGSLGYGVAAFGPGIVVQDVANQKDLPNRTELGAVITELQITDQGGIRAPGLRASKPEPGSKELWYDPDNNIVKFAP